MFDPVDRRLIREIQEDIPLSADPYGEIAQKIGCSKEEVLRRLQRYAEAGILKRIGAVMRHRELGFTVNAMVACRVAEDQIEAAGRKLASLPQVSHCYERETHPDWPYNLYGMFHGREAAELEKAVTDFVLEMQIPEYQILYSVKELKKSSMKFF